MSFMYPRLATFHRPAAQTGVGAQPYGGETVDDETAVPGASGIRCSIQARREGTGNTVALPGDANRPYWWAFIPKSALANGILQSRDILIDDLGTRYQVVAPYWDSLGYRVSVQSLEA